MRRGEVELAEVLAAISRAEQRLQELREAAQIPDQPDRQWVNEWLHRRHLAYWTA